MKKTKVYEWCIGLFVVVFAGIGFGKAEATELRFMENPLAISISQVKIVHGTVQDVARLLMDQGLPVGLEGLRGLTLSPLIELTADALTVEQLLEATCPLQGFRYFTSDGVINLMPASVLSLGPTYPLNQTIQAVHLTLKTGNDLFYAIGRATGVPLPMLSNREPPQFAQVIPEVHLEMGWTVRKGLNHLLRVVHIFSWSSIVGMEDNKHLPSRVAGITFQ